MATAVSELTGLIARGDAAKLLGISPERVNQLARAGELRFVQTPLGRLYEPEEVERLRRIREGINGERTE